jgi:hypothetical protein
VIGNGSQATAGSNNFVASIDLALLDTTDVTLPLDRGMAIASGQATNVGAVITSNVTNSTMSIVYAGQLPATHTLSGNVQSATTAVNSASLLLGKDPAVPTATGVIPVGMNAANSVQTGYAEITQDDTLSLTNVNSTAAISNAQSAHRSTAAALSAATVTNADVLLDLSATSGAIESQPLTVADNTISANFFANRASNLIQSELGSANVIGSMAVANSQSNVETVAPTANFTASVTLSTLTADLTSGVANTNTDLTGALTVQRNTLSATSTGNAAGQRNATGGIDAQNAIVLSNNFAGTGAITDTNASNLPSTILQTGYVRSDLGALSLQQNQSTSLNSRLDGGNIAVTVDHLEGGTGSITAEGNRQTSSTTGNLAGNLVAVYGGVGPATSFSGSAAANNLQLNSNVGLLAQTSATSLQVTIDNAGADVDTVVGAVSVNDNQIRSTTEGSAGSTRVIVSATNFSTAETGPTPRTAQAVTTTTGSASIQTGIVANNVQSNLAPGNATFQALVTDATVAARVVDALSSGSSFNVNDNLIRADVAGNSSLGQVSLSGTDANNIEAAVANTQVNLAPLTGSITGGSGVSLSTSGLSNSSNATAQDNTVAASATGNTATNLNSAVFTNAQVGTGFGLPGAAEAVASNSTANSSAAMAVVSAQSNNALLTVTNTTTNNYVLINAGSDTLNLGVAASNLTAKGNTAEALARGNNASNEISIVATTLTTAGGAASGVAGIANSQRNLGSMVVAAGDAGGGSATDPLIGIQFQQALEVAGGIRSTATVDDNKLLATAEGNRADNRLGMSGSLTSAAPIVGNISGFANSGAGTVQGELGIVNFQEDNLAAVATRSATITAGRIGIATGSDAIAGVVANITSADLTVSNNRIEADARNNDAVNSGSIGTTAAAVPLANTTFGVLNIQAGSTAVTAGATGTIGITAPVTVTTILDSNFSVTGTNLVKAEAVGNNATNALTVNAVILAGNALGGAAASGTDTNAGVVLVEAAYSLANSQAHTTGLLQSNITGSALVGFAGQTFGTTSRITVEDAAITGRAQANSAQNFLELNATGIGSAVNGATAAVASNQSNTGSPVAVTQTAASGNIAFGVLATSITGSASAVVQRNVNTIQAGQNEAVNQLFVGGTSITGVAAGHTQVVTAVAAGAALVGTEYAVSNVQVASGGQTTATANPGLSGINLTGALDTTGSISVVRNETIVSALGNSSPVLDATTGLGGNRLVLSGTTVATATAGLLNRQTASGAITAEQLLTGSTSFGVLAASQTGTDITVTNNAIRVTGGSNDAAINAVVVAASGITGGVGAGGNSVNLAGTTVVGTDFSSTNAQVASGAITVASTPGLVGIGITGTAASADFDVSDNAVDITGRANNAANAVQLGTTAAPLSSSNLATAGVANRQDATGAITVDQNLSAAGGTTFGVTAGGATVTSLNQTISRNTLTATGRQNEASNQALVIGGTLTGAAAGVGAAVANLAAAASSTSDLSVANMQTSSAAGTLSVEARPGQVGSNVPAAAISGAGSRITVTANTVTLDAKTNEATNTSEIRNMTTATSVTAAVSNVQQGLANVTAEQFTATTSPVAFGVRGLSADATPLVVTGNGSAVNAGQNDANNLVAVSGTTFATTGTASLGTNDIAAGGIVTVSTDLAVASSQTSAGIIRATNTHGTAGVRLADTLAGGELTVNNNSATANAKANNAVNTVTLSAGMSGGSAPSIATSNFQTASGNVTSQQVPATAGVGDAIVSFGVVADSAVGTPLTVNSNTLNSFARQNDSTNRMAVGGTNVVGATAGGGVSNFTGPVAAPTGVTSGASFSVLNAQQGTAGAVSATGSPAIIGTSVPDISGSINVTVNSNSALARADVNNADNALTLNATATLNATSAIGNLQTTTAANSASATMGTAAGLPVSSTIGVANADVLSPSSITVSNNAVGSQSAGNIVSNVLNTTAGSSLAATAVIPSTQILNFQSNLASSTALTQGLNIGLPGATSLTNTTVTVQGNVVSAFGYGNSASNLLGVSALPAGLSQTSNWITNTQANSGAIQATVGGAVAGGAGINIGVGAATGVGSASGGLIVVSNNSAVAQATANSAVSRIVGR